MRPATPVSLRLPALTTTNSAEQAASATNASSSLDRMAMPRERRLMSWLPFSMVHNSRRESVPQRSTHTVADEGRGSRTSSPAGQRNAQGGGTSNGGRIALPQTFLPFKQQILTKMGLYMCHLIHFYAPTREVFSTKFTAMDRSSVPPKKISIQPWTKVVFVFKDRSHSV